MIYPQGPKLKILESGTLRIPGTVSKNCLLSRTPSFMQVLLRSRATRRLHAGTVCIVLEGSHIIALRSFFVWVLFAHRSFQRCPGHWTRLENTTPSLSVLEVYATRLCGAFGLSLPDSSQHRAALRTNSSSDAS